MPSRDNDNSRDAFKLPSGTLSIRDEVITDKKNNMMSIKFLLIIVIAIIIGIVLSSLLFFRINEISVEGTDVYTAQEIIEAVGIKTGDNLFLCGMKDSDDKLPQVLPFIDSYKIAKKLPDKIVITVEEAKAICAVKTNVGYAILEKNAKVLEHVSSVPQNMTVLTGLDILDATPGHIILTDDEDDLYILKDIIVSMDNVDLERITLVDMTDTINICLYYNNKLRIEVGTVNDLENKLKRVKEVLGKLTNEIGRVDATIEGRISYIPLKEGESLIKQHHITNTDEDISKDADAEIPDDVNDKNKKDEQNDDQ